MFTNVYTPAPVTAVLKAEKTLENRTLKAGEFNFRLIGLNEAPMPEKDTVVNAAPNGAAKGEGPQGVERHFGPCGGRRWLG